MPASSYSNSAFRLAAITLALLSMTSSALAQRGGGHIGGTTAGGTGLSGGNRPTGIDTKDDLRDFHEIMAVQASAEQKIAFAAMLKSTEVAQTELQEFLEQLKKENNAAEVARRDKSLADAIDIARTLNKKFLEGFSEAQKSGLKEMVKRVGKADLDLGQQSRGLDQTFESKVAGIQISAAAEGLGRAIAGFEREQLGLGEEMSIDASNGASDHAYNLPPQKNTVDFANQIVIIETYGVVAKADAASSQNQFSAQITADLTDLQHSFTDVLRTQLNQTERCGERIQVETANFSAAQPASVAVTQFHYERWTCNTTFGRENTREVVEGNATLEVKLTPAVSDDGTLRLNAQLGSVDAPGLLGESLRTGALGETLRDEIANSVLSALSKGCDFKAALPGAARSGATLRRVRFQGTGAGRLLAVLEGDIRVSNDQLAALTTELKQQSAAANEAQPQLIPR